MKLFYVWILSLLFSSVVQALPAMKPFPPFRIVDNLYFVGNDYAATYLIVTSQGNILINADYQENVPLIKASVEKLGFKFSDTKILLISQAHADHSGGGALIKKETGAKYMVMDGDVSVIESGGKTDFQYGSSNDPENFFPLTKVDHVLHDGEKVKLGGVVLTAHHTAGHTKGCTTWTLQVTDKGKKLNVVIVGGPYVNPGYKLLNNPKYPAISQDFKSMFKKLKSLHCDIFLGAHGGYFGLENKFASMQNSKVNPFIDFTGYQKFILQAEHKFYQELNKQKEGV